MRLKQRGTQSFLLASVLFTATFHSSVSFTLTLDPNGILLRESWPIHGMHPTLLVLPSSLTLFSKPPPKTMFDLEEIERIEKGWKDEEQKNTANSHEEILEDLYEDDYCESSTIQYEFYVPEK